MVDTPGSAPTLNGFDADYEILRELGRGGMAVVYLALERSTGREVAIKVIHAKYLEDEEALARFAREARFVAKLHHSLIVPIHAVKYLSGSGLALVMERVPGRTLKQTIREDGPLSFARAQSILSDIAEALGFAHGQGIVHRDVKPENIFLDDRSGRALLSDFGIARSMNGETHLTLAGAAIGTPTYMSPEQIDGIDVDGRSDLFSLGLCGWEMLTGRRPWDGEGLYKVIYHQKHDYLAPLDQFRPDIPDRLLVAIEGLLEKDMSARWQSTDEFLAELAAEVPQPRRSPPESVEPLPTETMRFQRPPPVAAKPADALAALVASGAADVTARDDEMFAPGGWSRRTRRTAAVAASVAVLAGATLVFAWAERRTQPLSTLPAASNVRPSVPTAADSASGAAGRGLSSGTGAPSVAAAGDSTRAAPDSLSVAAAPPQPVARGGTIVDSTARLNAAAARPTDAPANVVFKTQPPIQQPLKQPTSPQIASRPPVAKPDPIRAPTPQVVLAPVPAVTGPPAGSGASSERFAIVPGGLHTCFLSLDGRGYCWGGNGEGQIGNGGTSRVPSPTEISGDVRFNSMASGMTHTCAVSKTGGAYCWGNNDHGQLGDGSSTSRSAPTAVPGNRSYRAIATGAGHTCAIERGGDTYCWGANAHGQLGDGRTADRLAPAAVPGGARFTSISAGWNHTCALLADGRASCWGDNSAGELGDGTTIDKWLPTPVRTDLRFIAISGGSAHTCGLTASGEAYCWGQNRSGQLGDGTTSDRSVPVKVRSGARVVAITTGGFHTCALTGDSETLCWGRNTYGQLGDGSTTDHGIPARVTGGHAFTAIHAFGSHTCGTTVTGESFCWGYNLEGQLGDGTRTHRSRPVYVEKPAG